MDVFQSVSCVACILSEEGSVAVFPSSAVASSGTVTGSLATLDEMGRRYFIPSRRYRASVRKWKNLKALAHMAFSSLDDDQFDDTLTDISDFWQKPPADTRPRIFYVQGDLAISGCRFLHGILFVDGTHVYCDDESGFQGVLYAPNASDVTMNNTDSSGRVAACGRLITGSSVL
jgi:hypothetical protein